MNKKVKTHFKNNWPWYVAGVSVVAVGAIAYSVGVSRVTASPTQKALTITGDISQIQTNNIIQMLERRGHPGNVVRCLETGEVFASQNRAASLLGLSPSKLSEHINGARENINGFHFEKLGEAVA